MPSVRIHVRKDYSEAEETAIMNAVQAALVVAFGVKPEDTNILLMAHRSHRFMCPPDRDDPERYTNITVVSHASRAAEAKRRFYTAVVDNLEALGIPRNCSLIQLHELPPGDIAIRGGHPMTDFPTMIDAEDH
ncbi:MAG: tautomerase family protein [Pseudomonadota bacterium]